MVTILFIAGQWGLPIIILFANEPGLFLSLATTFFFSLTFVTLLFGMVSKTTLQSNRADSDPSVSLPVDD